MSHGYLSLIKQIDILFFYDHTTNSGIGTAALGLSSHESPVEKIGLHIGIGQS